MRRDQVCPSSNRNRRMFTHFFLQYTNLIPHHGCNLWGKPLANHSLKCSLETQQCKQSFKLKAANFCHQRVCRHHYSRSFLLRNNRTKMILESLQDRSGLRWAVRARGSGLYIAKGGCVSKHSPLLLLGETWPLNIADSCRWESAHRIWARTSTKPQSNAKDKAYPEVVQPVVYLLRLKRLYPERETQGRPTKGIWRTQPW